MQIYHSFSSWNDNNFAWIVILILGHIFLFQVEVVQTDFWPTYLQPILKQLNAPICSEFFAIGVETLHTLFKLFDFLLPLFQFLIAYELEIT